MMTDNNSNWVPSMSTYIDEEALMKLRKVGIIGTGHVGSHVAFSLALQGEVDELYMMDIDEKKAKAQAMLMMRLVISLIV